MRMYIPSFSQCFFFITIPILYSRLFVVCFICIPFYIYIHILGSRFIFLLLLCIHILFRTFVCFTQYILLLNYSYLLSIRHVKTLYVSALENSKKRADEEMPCLNITRPLYHSLTLFATRRLTFIHLYSLFCFHLLFLCFTYICIYVYASHRRYFWFFFSIYY